MEVEKKVDQVEVNEQALFGHAVVSELGPAGQLQVLWLGRLLPRLLMTPNGSQWLPTTPDSSLRLQTHAVVV